ncbi:MULTISPECIES: PepSY domain-containing protein [Brasilonema]|uniref:PepSY domain-containing protein n=1 Tax=Brasilonema TaxID=383614 RepID=UPI00145D52C6
MLDVFHPPDNPVTEISLAQISSVFVNPYTGTIMSKQRWNEQLISLAVDLHCNLLAGNTGKTIVGIVCFLVLVLNITGEFGNVYLSHSFFKLVLLSSWRGFYCLSDFKR